MKILFGKTFQSIFSKHKKEVFDWYNSEVIKPIKLSQLTLRFSDSNGKTYYGFPKDMMLPLERHGKLMSYMQYITKGLTSKEDEDIDNALAKIVLTEKDPVKISIRQGAIFAEKERRRTMCIHTELFYNYLAVQLVREDEDPEVFDNDIQMQKVTQFKEEAKKKGSTYHYFQQPEFKKLSDMLRLSESEWDQSWLDSLDQQSLLKEILEVYSSASI